MKKKKKIFFTFNYFQTLEMSSDHRRERQIDSEKIRRLTNQMEVIRQEKERCELRIHSLEQQVRMMEASRPYHYSSQHTIFFFLRLGL